MKRPLYYLVLLAFCLTGCPSHVPLFEVPPIIGSLEDTSDRRIAAEVNEVANGATVALIDPASGNTLVSTLTSGTGQFNLSFAGTGFKPTAGPYFLEAAKGLAMGGVDNRAGATLLRLRTLVSFQGGAWQSLTPGRIMIGRSSTAICILSNLKGLDNTQNLALLGTLEMGTRSFGEGIRVPDTFAGDAHLSATEFIRAFDLVNRAIAEDLDPIAALFKRPADSTGVVIGPGFSLRPELAMGLDGWTLNSISPVRGPADTLVTLHGQGLSTDAAELAVSLSGQACTVTEASPDGTYLRFRVPTGLAPGTYPLIVTYGPWSYHSLTYEVTP